MVILKGVSSTTNSGSLREWLREIRANMPGAIGPLTVNAIVFNKGTKSIVARLDDGVVFSVDVHEGSNLAPLIQHCWLAELITPVD